MNPKRDPFILEKVMNNTQYPLARTNGLVVQEVPNEVLVFDMETNEAHCLNETAAMVWKYCDGETSVAKIAEILGSSKGSDINEDLIWLAIDQLNEHKLLERKVDSKFAGHSRREVLRKIGLASMVALPVIASMAAPRSVMAQTSCNCANNGACRNGSMPGCPTGSCSSNVCVP
jgi:hypothetical protein